MHWITETMHILMIYLYLKPGTPLSVLTPDPVCTTMFLDFARISRNARILTESQQLTKLSGTALEFRKYHAFRALLKALLALQTVINKFKAITGGLIVAITSRRLKFVDRGVAGST